MADVVYGDFEWEDDKAATNLAKHGVSFEEAATVFSDPCYILLADQAKEGSFWAIGLSGRTGGDCGARGARPAGPNRERAKGHRSGGSSL